MATKYNLNKFNLYNNLILNKMQIPNKIKPQNSFNRLRKSPTFYQFFIYTQNTCDIELLSCECECVSALSRRFMTHFVIRGCQLQT